MGFAPLPFPRSLSGLARSVGLAFGLSVVMTVQVATANGTWRSLAAGTLAWPAVVLLFAMVLTATSALLHMLALSLKADRSSLLAAQAALAMTTRVGLAATDALGHLPAGFVFASSLLADGAFALSATALALSHLKLRGAWVDYPPRLAVAGVALTGCLVYATQSWLPLSAGTQILTLIRDVAVAITPLVVLLACGLHRSLRLDPNSFRRSLSLRLPGRRDGAAARAKRWSLAIQMVGAMVTLALNSSRLVRGAAFGTTGSVLAAFEPLATLSAFSLAWLGIADLAWRRLLLVAAEQTQGALTANLASYSAKRFLKRHSSDKSHWAATVGLRTTNFSIDHDPNGSLGGQLPATIMHIRSEEIQRCVDEVLGSMHLHTNVLGHRIAGAVDPEIAVRPCIDTLRMFACLYLDAGPLVERRIKGLTQLLPIVDPSLAKVLKAGDVDQLIRRNAWFFHFDFGWIDQHLLHSPRQTRYDVHIGSLPTNVRLSMLSYLEKNGGIGNFVWIGPDARERLLQEAPAMKNVVEACPIPLLSGAEGAPATGDELLMFIVRFEQLIPRLQRYFDLDTMRKALLDYEPSYEASRLQDILRLQISRAATAPQLQEALDAIVSVPWRGYREKDDALSLILAAHLHQEEMVKKLGQPEGTGREALIEAVRAIGYPSQILHDAQIYKQALRDVDFLTAAASDPGHPRFIEAWLLLATSDYGRYTSEGRLAFLHFLRDLRLNRRLAGERLVQMKSVDALASLGRSSHGSEIKDVWASASALSQWFAKSKADLDLCSLLLDAHLFLASHLDGGLALSPDAMSQCEAYFMAVSKELGPTHPQVIAVHSRWQELSHKSRSMVATGHIAA